MKKLKLIALALCTTLMISSCVAQYTVPKENEPHALLKIKVSFDRAKHLQSLPVDAYSRSLQANLMLTETTEDGKVSDPMQVIAVVDQMSAGQIASPIEIFSSRLQPGKKVTLILWNGIFWQTRTREMVRKSRQVPQQVMKNVSKYDSYTQKYVSSYEYVTEYKTEYYDEMDWKIRDFRLGCQAVASVTPQEGKIYLLDYTNHDLAKTCTSQIFQQEVKKGGGFKLTPVQ